MIKKYLIIVRGGGDLATGTICKLFHAGFRVIVLEAAQPTVIRHTVAFAQCINKGDICIEGIHAKQANTWDDVRSILQDGMLPVLIDPQGDAIEVFKPFAVVDAIIAKRNLGTHIHWAPIVVGLGPGFTAGKDVHAVVETMRGHNLGRVYFEGCALPDTGIPGDIGGFTEERIVRAPIGGIFVPVKSIGDAVQKGDILGQIQDTPVLSPLTGVLRGMLNEGLYVKAGMKIGDVDPRNIEAYCYTISDKARAIGGGVLEAILQLANHMEDKENEEA